jgi:hypothetical protein
LSGFGPARDAVPPEPDEQPRGECNQRCEDNLRVRIFWHQLRRGLYSLWSPVPKSQKIVDLAFPPAMILGCKRIDAGIYADVANEKLWALDKVRYLVNGSLAEAACGNRHRPSPQMPIPRNIWRR